MREQRRSQQTLRLVAKTWVVAEGRIDAARARARGAKLALGAVATLVLGTAFVGAKAHAAGHTKHRARPLAAPRSFERAVRRSVLAGGQIAPPVQPPPVVTSTS
jgi:hypothetical protein